MLAYSLVKIIVTVTDRQIMCSSCTKTIKTALLNLLLSARDCQGPSVQAYDCDEPSDKKNTIMIEFWSTKHNSTTHTALQQECIKTIRDLGFDPVGVSLHVNIAHEDLEQGETTFAPTKEHDIASTRDNTAISGFAFLTLGTTLMVLDEIAPPKQHWLLLIIGSIASTASLIGARHYLRNALQRQTPMDTLVSLGCISAIVYSFLSLQRPALLNEDESMPTTFFDIPPMLLGFLKLSHALRKRIERIIKAQESTIERTQDTLPQSIYLEQGGINPVIDTQPGTRIIVFGQEIIPLDSLLIEPQELNNINEYFLRGNHGTQTKYTGDTLYAGTLNPSTQPIILETIQTAQNNQIYHALATVRNTATQDPLIQYVIQYYLIGILAIAVSSAMAWFFFGSPDSINLACQVFLSVILTGCPCGLGLLSLNETIIKFAALKQGILIKSLNALNNTAQITDICIDKCGTVTEGQYEINSADEALLRDAVLLQQQIPQEQLTAIGKAILKKAETVSTADVVVSDYVPYAPNPGRGGQIKIGHDTFTMGNRRLLQHFKISLPDQLPCEATVNGTIRVYCARNGIVIGTLECQPVAETAQILRDDFIATLRIILARHQSVHILTGDESLSNAKALAEQLMNQLAIRVEIYQPGSSEPLSLGDPDHSPILIHVNLIPNDKQAYIAQLKQTGAKVLMIGDGQNDIKPIEEADIGVAINAQAPCAEYADVVIDDQFFSLIHLTSLSDTYREAYHSSLLLTFGINIGLIVLAAGALYPLTQHMIDPMWISMGMASSSLILVMTIALWKTIAESRIQQSTDQPAQHCSALSLFHCPRGGAQFRDSLNISLIHNAQS